MDANAALFPAERRAFHLDRYEFARSYCESRKVLDGACGTGYGSALIGEVASDTTGIDCDEGAIDYASRTYSRDNVRFERSFVEFTRFEDAAFDVVLSFETVEHTLCPMAHMREVARLLKPETGCAVLSVPNNWGYTDHHFFDFNLRLFQRILNPFFSSIEFFYQNPRSSKTPKPGIGKLEDLGPDRAQCILAVCRGPRWNRIDQADRLRLIMDEIYQNAFDRHRDFRTLAYRQNTSLFRRARNRIARLARHNVRRHA